MEVLTAGLAFPEAPVLLDDGSWLVAELAPERGQVTAVSRDGRTHRVVARTGRPNGICVQSDGTVWIAESLEPSLLRLRPGAQVERTLAEVDGVPLLWPNDVCIGPDGWIYVTDSGIPVGDLLDPGGGVRDDFRSLTYRGLVWRYDPRTQTSEVLDAGLQFANGIAFGPDERLYVSESLTGNVYRYAVGAGRAERESFGNVIAADLPRDGWHGPDGMCFSADGRLWVTVFGQGHVAVLGPDGAVVERLELAGRGPTNAAFGRPGERRLYVVETELGQIEVHDVGVDGLPLHG